MDHTDALAKKKILSGLILERRRHFITYPPYQSQKKPYYDAVGQGDTAAVKRLNAGTHQYARALFEKSHSYSDVVYQLQYDCLCAAVEFCLIAIQSGLTDMIAYDVRDEFIKEIADCRSIPALDELFGRIAAEYALLVHYSSLRSPLSPAVAQIISYIAQHLEDKLTLQELADAAGLSRGYACTVFKKQVGMGLREYIVSERIGKAKQLLAETRLSVYEISSRLQFCSQSHFTRRFSEATHMTPSAYRSRCLSQDAR